MTTDFPPGGWARAWRRSDLTLDEAAGQRAMRDRIVTHLRDAAAEMRLRVLMDIAPSAAPVRAVADALDMQADHIARMEPQASEETGLEGRGA
jgi:hypothetical protein